SPMRWAPGSPSTAAESLTATTPPVNPRPGPGPVAGSPYSSQSPFFPLESWVGLEADPHRASVQGQGARPGLLGDGHPAARRLNLEAHASQGGHRIPQPHPPDVGHGHGPSRLGLADQVEDDHG